MYLSRRLLLRDLAFLAALGALAACQPAPPGVPTPSPSPTEAKPAPAAQPKPGEKEVVSLNLWWNTQPATKTLIDTYNQTQTGIKLNLSDIGELVFGDEKYTTAVAAGKGPDIAYQNRHTFLQFASQGLYAEITDLLSRDGYKAEDFFPIQIKEVQWKGRFYGLPHGTDTRLFYWNKKHYREVGLDPEKPPTTWTELEEYTAKLNKAANSKVERYGHLPYGVGNTWLWLFLWINKGKPLSEDGRTATPDDPRIVEALEWLGRFYEKYVPGGAEAASGMISSLRAQATDPFYTEQLAQIGHGNWYLNTLARKPSIEYGLAPYPISARGERSNWSCGFSFVVAATSKQREEGWQVIKWLISADAWRVLAKWNIDDTKKTWEREKVSGTPYWVPALATYKPAMQAITQEFGESLPPKVRKEFELTVDALNWTHGCGEMGLAALQYWVEMDRAVQAVINRRATAREALAEVKRKVQAALDEAWKKAI